MKRLLGFVRHSLVDGALVLLPIWLTAWLIMKAVRQIEPLVTPITKNLPHSIAHPRLVAIVLLLTLCFLIGLIVRTRLGKSSWDVFEASVLRRIPGYKLVRGITNSVAGLNEESRLQPAMLESGEALVPAFIVEKHRDNRCTVFVPSAPNPTSGSISIVAASRVHPVNVSLMTTLRCLSHWGSGSDQLLSAMRSPSAPRETDHGRELG